MATAAISIPIVAGSLACALISASEAGVPGIAKQLDATQMRSLIFEDAKTCSAAVAMEYY